MNRITLCRRIVQVVCFVLLMYGGFIWGKGPEVLPKIPTLMPSTTMYARNRILWVSAKESVFDLYLPALACRFIAKGGLFKSCMVHFFSENFTWRTSLRIMIPHMLWLFVLCLMFGRLWCGWVCPMGAIMDAMTWARRRLGLPRVYLTPGTERFLFYVRHFMLWFCLLVSVFIAFPVLGQGANDALFLLYCQFCPARLLYPGFGYVNPCWKDTTSAITLFLTFCGWGTFALFFLGFAIPRFWCRICAIGTMTGYFNRGALVSLEKNPQKCSSCGTCARNCPVDIPLVHIDRKGPVVTDPQCQLCLTCLEDCPEPGCLELKYLGKTILKS
jgi:polyferredoxin